jgi:prepilin-type N-terminal cleavage/methylation domain-containing protein
MKTLRSRQGFTLIELLVAVLVIGIISALVYPKFGPVRERTYVAAMKNSLNKMVSAQENYLDANGQYGTLANLQGIGFELDEDVTGPGGIGSPTITLHTSSNPQYGWQAVVGHSKTMTECGIQYGSSGPAPTGVEYTQKVVCNPGGSLTFP